MSILILMTLLLLLASCQQQEAEQELITVDVAASVPEKELIVQDFMDVEYVPLETNDDFLVPNNVAAIGESYIVMRSRGNDGTLYFFDRHSGKASESDRAFLESFLKTIGPDDNNFVIVGKLK